MNKPLVAIVGRPNVGKSTLFNRIVGTRAAVVEAQPGVTRDRLHQDAEWAGRAFTLVDTGGIDTASEDTMATRVTAQAQQAIAEADLIMFVLDSRDGLVPEDIEVANILRRAGKPVIPVINKIDNFDQPLPLAEFYSLGLGDPVPVSAQLGLNVGDLLDEVVARLAVEAGDTREEQAVKVAFIGRPNVGKSSLVNSILGEERVIVSDIPGTTRDAIDTFLERDGRRYVFIDTAGIRRRSRISEPVERYSVMRSQRALERADIAVLVIDAVEGVTAQDKRIAGLAEEAGRGTIIAVNKWDLVPKDSGTMNRYTEAVRRELAFISYAPLVYTSAVTGHRVRNILDAVDSVYAQFTRRVQTSDFNRLMQDAFLAAPPPAEKGRRLKCYYATQVSTGPPTFVLFVNDPALGTNAYRRYLENQVRRAYGFEGTPVRIIWRGRETK
ncbi:MAG: ribosome biogenesis GTPase Der [Bacillota bacterium]|uniref:ribosome biogenesis GTPase Der n=1 Tax=Desulforudis sp. DRI-14 TaxID=3459793 RepID=UPI0034775ACC